MFFLYIFSKLLKKLVGSFIFCLLKFYTKLLRFLGASYSSASEKFYSLITLFGSKFVKVEMAKSNSTIDLSRTHTTATTKCTASGHHLMNIRHLLMNNYCHLLMNSYLLRFYMLSLHSSFLN